MAKAGQPTKYKPIYCKKAIELGKQGKQTVSIACACGVSKQTIHEWASVHPEFSDALAQSRAFCEQWYLNKAQERAEGGNPGASDTLIKFMLSAAHGYREKTDVNMAAQVDAKITVASWGDETEPN